MARRSGSNGTAAEAALELACSFGNVSVGDATASVGCTVTRDQLSLAKADKVLCGHRLTVNLTAQADGAQPEQGELPGMEGSQSLELSAIVDVKAFRATRKTISFGIVCNSQDVDIGNLARFAKKSGQMLVVEVGDLPETAKPASEEDE